MKKMELFKNEYLDKQNCLYYASRLLWLGFIRQDNLLFQPKGYKKNNRRIWQKEMTMTEIFFMMLSFAMAFAASLFAYDCNIKEEEIENQRKELSFLSEMLKQSLLSSIELSVALKKDFGGKHGKEG